MQRNHCWDIFEIEFSGPSNGNPFIEIQFSAQFQTGSRILETEGFYDGSGIYRIRFMPDTPGLWRFATRSNAAQLNNHSGEFLCVEARPGVHGTVNISQTYHFSYQDGTRYFPIGTTCYAWINQPDEVQEQTLQTLAGSPFNKIRMCVFPKDYTFNKNDPVDYAFEQPSSILGQPSPEPYQFDFSRFNPAFFRRFEKRIGQLADLGIEADIILFHPYDRWGFSRMPAEVDDRYLRYIVARVAAYRNVWWSMANEYDVMPAKNLLDWDRFFRIIQQYDPYQHLRSIHNWQRIDTHDWKTFYDHAKPWVTHCSVQNSHVDLVNIWREQYRKPVVVDECCYEGNIPNGWGNITPQEMTRRFWEATVKGGYCGHGETYLDPQHILWWAKGGVLKGESPQRIAFLRNLLEKLPPGYLDPVGRITNTHLQSAGQPGVYYLTYFGTRQPGEVAFQLPEEWSFRVDIIDTWEMKITSQPEQISGRAVIQLPTSPYLAVQLTRV
jgi:hypothetical protein